MRNDLKSLKQGVTFFDKITENIIGVQITENYLTVRINGRYYYFNADDGKYDGYSDKRIDITAIDTNKLPSQIDAIFSQG